VKDKAMLVEQPLHLPYLLVTIEKTTPVAVAMTTTMPMTMPTTSS
jgi:hypothetical protein